MILIHDMGKICSENGTHQRTDLGVPGLERDFPVAEKTAEFHLANLLHRVREEKGFKEKEVKSGFKLSYQILVRLEAQWRV